MLLSILFARGSIYIYYEVMTQAAERKHPFFCHMTKFLGDNRLKRLENGMLLVDLGLLAVITSMLVFLVTGSFTA
jgi:hypothetical protein